ncbi:MAG: hypothetical protein JWQ69_3771, partial [Pseudomonas sp.]|nr:hypothetical protein [Pseudomonas sp.]
MLKIHGSHQHCCESGLSATEDVGCAGLFAGKPAPTGNIAFLWEQIQLILTSQPARHPQLARS